MGAHGGAIPLGDPAYASHARRRQALARGRATRGRSPTRAAGVPLPAHLAQCGRPAGDRRPSGEVGGHYERAGRRNEAYRHALRAWEHALAVYETVAAAELLAAAERNAPSDDALADVRVRMAALAEAAGQYEQVESLCEQVLSWYEAH